jgi:hypothetical protein
VIGAEGKTAGPARLTILRRILVPVAVVQVRRHLVGIDATDDDKAEENVAAAVHALRLELVA